jgi:hemerythrin-like domain-containing protein
VRTSISSSWSLHHHHAAEDELIWPNLHARVPTHDDEINRMENAHRAIAAAVDAAKAAGRPWAKTGRGAEHLIGAAAGLIDVVDEYLDDEERKIVPLIEKSITAFEWKKAIARGASILRTHPNWDW